MASTLLDVWDSSVNRTKTLALWSVYTNTAIWTHKQYVLNSTLKDDKSFSLRVKGKFKQRIEMEKVGGKVEFNRIILIGRPGPLVLFFFRGVLFTNSYMIPLLIAIWL